MEVASEYKRDSSVRCLRMLKEGHTFLRANVGDDDSKLRAAARAGCSAAVIVLLRNDPSLARKPTVADPNGALIVAAQAGHEGVLIELVKRGALEVKPKSAGPTPLQAAVATNQGATANLLHKLERAAGPLQVGSWTELPHGAPNVPPLCGFVADTKLSRGRCAVVDMWEPLLCSPGGSANLEASFFRWIEAELSLAIWVPVDHLLYSELGGAVERAINSYNSAAHRDAVLHLATSMEDSMWRLNQVLLFAQTPYDLMNRCTKGLLALFGKEVYETNWERLTPKMRDWVAKVTFFFPCCPWGRAGWKETPAYQAGRGTDPDAEGDQMALLEITMLELLTKARILYTLFEDDTEQGRKRSRRHSVLPFQPNAPESCPYEKKKDWDPSDARSYSAVLFLLAPCEETFVRENFPQVLQLNGSGIAGEGREKLSHRILQRLLLNSVPGANPKWVLLPAVYSAHLATVALAKLGGPRNVVLRHPNSGMFVAHGGGDIALAADDLDEMLKLMLEPDAKNEVSKRTIAMFEASNFQQPESVGPAGVGVLLLEEMVPGSALPQDGKKGWYDPTQRAYCVQAHARPAPPPTEEAPTAAPLVLPKISESDDDDDDDDDDGPVLEEVEEDEPKLEELDTHDAGAIVTDGKPEPVEPQAVHAVIGGTCRFPSQPLSASAGMICHAQHMPLLAFTGVPLGKEMASGAFSTRMPLGPLTHAMHSLPLRQLITHCLSSQLPLLHLAALSILSATTAGSRCVRYDAEALRMMYYEFMGRPYNHNATLWDEHKPLLLELTSKDYVTKHGATLAKLVQRRLIYDVVVKDFAAIASNKLREADEAVVAIHRALEQSTFEVIRNEARDIRSAFTEMSETGMQSEKVELANPAQMEALIDMLDNY